MVEKTGWWMPEINAKSEVSKAQAAIVEQRESWDLATSSVGGFWAEMGLEIFREEK